MVEMERYLRASGKRVTAERRLVLRIIEENPHLDATEIYQRARRDNPKISLSTVYRTTKLLTQLGLVEELDLGEGHHRYEIRLQEHYHLICLGCGRVVEVPSAEVVKKLAHEQGFSVATVKLEIFGYCPDCRERFHLVRESRPQIRADRVVDLRDLSPDDCARAVQRAVDEARSGELIDIITAGPHRVDVATHALQGVGKVTRIKNWEWGAVRHTVVRRD